MDRQPPSPVGRKPAALMLSSMYSGEGARTPSLSAWACTLPSARVTAVGAPAWALRRWCLRACCFWFTGRFLDVAQLGQGAAHGQADVLSHLVGAVVLRRGPVTDDNSHAATGTGDHVGDQVADLGLGQRSLDLTLLDRRLAGPALGAGGVGVGVLLGEEHVK